MMSRSMCVHLYNFLLKYYCLGNMRCGRYMYYVINEGENVGFVLDNLSYSRIAISTYFSTTIIVKMIVSGCKVSCRMHVILQPVWLFCFKYIFFRCLSCFCSNIYHMIFHFKELLILCLNFADSKQAQR